MNTNLESLFELINNTKKVLNQGSTFVDEFSKMTSKEQQNYLEEIAQTYIDKVTDELKPKQSDQHADNLFNLHTFQQQSLRTESKTYTHFKAPRYLLEEALKSYIAAGNILDQIKKSAFYGSQFDLPKYKRTLAQLSADLQVSARTIYELDHIRYNPNNEPVTTFMDLNPRTIHALLGMNTESAEIAEALLTYLQTGKIDVVNVSEEIADNSWYASILYDEYNIDPYQPLINVIEKLKKRYPEKFSKESAEQRDLSAEREILEKNI